jgi:asparagine synthase (glutamine-hydrolysing)
MTLGLPTDFDVRCAAPVARTLGFAYRTVEIPVQTYAACAHLQARWEHGCAGFTTIHGWGVYPHLRDLGPRVLTAHVGDAIVGGSHMHWAGAPRTDVAPFDAVFRHVNAYGFRPETLRRLLRPEVFGDLVDVTVAHMRRVYAGYEGLEAQRAWSFDLHHRQRFHVGGEAWRLSFGAWPILPVIDREILEVTGGIPPASLADRRAQDALFRRRFPTLAALPFAHSPFRVSLGRPPLGWWVWLHVDRQRSNALRAWARLRGRRFQQRYNARVYDVNGPGWRAIRRAAEPCRESVGQVFHRAVLDAILPPPEVPIRCRDPIVDSSGHKSLLGFLLWSMDHL